MMACAMASAVWKPVLCSVFLVLARCGCWVFGVISPRVSGVCFLFFSFLHATTCFRFLFLFCIVEYTFLILLLAYPSNLINRSSLSISPVLPTQPCVLFCVPPRRHTSPLNRPNDRPFPRSLPILSSLLALDTQSHTLRYQYQHVYLYPLRSHQRKTY